MYSIVTSKQNVSEFLMRRRFETVEEAEQFIQESVKSRASLHGVVFHIVRIEKTFITEVMLRTS